MSKRDSRTGWSIAREILTLADAEVFPVVIATTLVNSLGLVQSRRKVWKLSAKATREQSAHSFSASFASAAIADFDTVFDSTLAPK
jgi:hypothetical protein